MTNGMFYRIEGYKAFAPSGRIPNRLYTIPRAMPRANRSLAFQAVPQGASSTQRAIGRVTSGRSAIHKTIID